MVTWHLKDVPAVRRTLCLGRGLISVVSLEKTGILENLQNTRMQQSVHWRKLALPHKKDCSELGARYSVLQELEYFDRIRYFAVDPMHNLYPGTSKHMMRSVSLNEKIDFLNDEDFQFLKIFSYTRKDFIKFLRIHSRSMEKLDISVFIVFAQRNPPEDHSQRWRFFLLACETLGMGDLTDNDIEIGDGYLMQFCKTFETLYG